MRIGIDLGGTKIEAAAFADDGCELVRQRIPTPRDDYDATLSAIVDLIQTIERRTGAAGTVGIGIPGAISRAKSVVKNANSTWLNGRPLGDDLPRLLERPVRFENDANCFAFLKPSMVPPPVPTSCLAPLSGQARVATSLSMAAFCTVPTRSRANGAQSAALSEGGRVAMARLLLRADRLYRDVSIGAGFGARLRGCRRRRALGADVAVRADAALGRWCMNTN